MSSTQIRMESTELASIKDSIIADIDIISEEVSNHARILDSLNQNQYMSGSVEATQLVKEKVVSSFNQLKETVDSLITILNTAMVRTEETESRFKDKFATLTDSSTFDITHDGITDFSALATSAVSQTISPQQTKDNGISSCEIGGVKISMPSDMDKSTMTSTPSIFNTMPGEYRDIVKDALNTDTSINNDKAIPFENPSLDDGAIKGAFASEAFTLGDRQMPQQSSPHSTSNSVIHDVEKGLANLEETG